MGDLVVVSEEHVAGAPDAVFGRFGGAGAGWLFDASCDAVVPGAVVRFRIPASAGGEPIQSTGRIVEVEPGRRLVLVQESPWLGRVTLTFSPDGTGTRVRLRADLGEDCVPWLMRASGHDVVDPVDSVRSVRVGVLLSLSGPAGLFGRGAHNAGDLAVEELNAEGGIRGVPLRLYYADDGTDSLMATREFVRLVDLLRCDVVIAMVTSASMAALRPLAESRGTLVLYAPANEAGEFGPRVVNLGVRPVDQLAHSVPRMMRETGGRGWFLIGNDYSWPRGVAQVAREVIERAGGVVLDERYVAFGREDYADVLGAIEASRTDHVLSSMVGTDAVNFERSFFQAGLRSQTRTIATLVDDVVREHIGDEAATGLWSVLDHFAELDTPENLALTRRWRERFGPFAPPLSSTAKWVFDAIAIYAAAARAARSVEPGDVARALRAPQGRARRPLVRVFDAPRPACIAEAVPGGFVVRAP